MRQAFALIISLALGLLAVYAMKNYINQEKRAANKKVAMVEVLCTTRQIIAKSVIERADLKMIELPETSVTPDMVKMPEIGVVEGKTIQREVNRGGVLFHSDFLGKQRERMSGISKGRRLLSVPVSQVTGVSGLIKPGSRVDLLYTESASAKRGGAGADSSSTAILLENVTVYATDSQTIDIPQSSMSNRGRSYSTLVLSVTPTEAAVLVAANRLGTITFTLRSKSDFTPSKILTEVDKNSLVSLAKDENKKRWDAIKKLKANSK
ncbi:MAG: Flp pilus assembly protein CpaB [Planctomycetes bacterium]|nr:Flp pilus assembly protein CpaB [Planctomycetota bacterium]